jgi:hypothetical protein
MVGLYATDRKRARRFGSMPSMMPMRANIVGPLSDRSLPLIEQLLGLRKPRDVISGVFEGDDLATVWQGYRISSNGRFQPRDCVNPIPIHPQIVLSFDHCVCHERCLPIPSNIIAHAGSTA